MAKEDKSNEALLQRIVNLDAEIASLNGEVNDMHSALELKGYNSRNTKDIFGRVFPVPVDVEHKALGLHILKCGNPQPRAFHASWFGFFVTFFSTFAAAPLGPTLKESKDLGGLGLTPKEWAAGNMASVSGTIIFRLITGTICDKLGARRGLAFLLFGTVPALIGIIFVQNAAGFIVCRCIIGCSLASFVACQVWCTQQFSKSTVGLANATAGGWGNLGGGMTNLLMPLIYEGILAGTGDDKDGTNRAWRLCFLVPLGLHVIAGLFTLTGRDLPDGNFKELETSGAKQKSDVKVVLKVGASNINAWILTITYGFCFGVELTITNVAALYFYEYHGIEQTIAGILASIFGLVNIFARSLGGMTSDWANARFGMRGRLWMLWFWQTVEGVLCLILGLVTLKYTAPDVLGTDTIGYAKADGDWYQVSGMASGLDMIGKCVQKEMKISDDQMESLDEAIQGKSKLLVQDPPPPLGTAEDCVRDSNTIGLVVFLLFIFSITVQMAEGLTFGVVPDVSRPALGVVNGMVGAGGNVGSLITLAAFFNGTMRTDLGFVQMGATIIGATLLCFGLYWPEYGGMLFKPGQIKYDPQLIKPPAGYRGADAMDFDSVVDAAADDKKDAPAENGV